jgi:hypothetical protein
MIVPDDYRVEFVDKRGGFLTRPKEKHGTVNVVARVAR